MKRSHKVRVKRLTLDLGEEVPVFDIADYYLPNDTQNLLVNNQRFGDAMANTFLTPAHNASNANTTQPDHNLVLQRGHGFSVVGSDLLEAVYRAIYTNWNAEVQSSAVAINHGAQIDRGIEYLTPGEVAGTLSMERENYFKNWPLWAAQVGVDPLYKNDLGYAAYPTPSG